jgi:Amt family ammonium transporter
MSPTCLVQLHALFQMMFATITPLIMTGSYAERLKWEPFLVFTFLWEIVVYYPCVHWVWGGGFLSKWGVLDFAGGIVIHTSAGAVSAQARPLGRRDAADAPLTLRGHRGR